MDLVIYGTSGLYNAKPQRLDYYCFSLHENFGQTGCTDAMIRSTLKVGFPHVIQGETRLSP